MGIGVGVIQSFEDSYLWTKTPQSSTFNKVMDILAEGFHLFVEGETSPNSEFHSYYHYHPLGNKCSMAQY